MWMGGWNIKRIIKIEIIIFIILKTQNTTNNEFKNYVN
jgi:hypothetical protein